MRRRPQEVCGFNGGLLVVWWLYGAFTGGFTGGFLLKPTQRSLVKAFSLLASNCTSFCGFGPSCLENGAKHPVLDPVWTCLEKLFRKFSMSEIERCYYGLFPRLKGFFG